MNRYNLGKRKKDVVPKMGAKYFLVDSWSLPLETFKGDVFVIDWMDKSTNTVQLKHINKEVWDQCSLSRLEECYEPI